ncbi:hypothetical protein N7481_001368 [Penicillium waksmanii]|uniref:uncharacterized protein n=1 Tax=Penicillium waksmanii TaxID=69791 RepID=UPI0025472B41|nr:uncharacterized protein N7481_008490 [Penicillium waksmanii]XP_057128419.1 uncharacterized protein N7481_001368 [Penicillium waksmanii]KAJ5974783.1 hypothetical protein N7481_008490 [Penicillium waksmanii]KAJ6000959.1 hypothetical protein N7481_001368 [Penicillium waksmanii]
MSENTREKPNHKQSALKKLLGHLSRSRSSRSFKDGDPHSSDAEAKTYEDYLRKDEENLEEYYKKEEDKITKEDETRKDESGNYGALIDN